MATIGKRKIDMKLLKITLKRQKQRHTKNNFTKIGKFSSRAVCLFEFEAILLDHYLQ